MPSRGPYWTDEDERDPPETLASEGREGDSKCGHHRAETDAIAVTGDGLSRYVDYQNRAFVAVSCTDCGYTEFYRRRGGGDLVDRFLA